MITNKRHLIFSVFLLIFNSVSSAESVSVKATIQRLTIQGDSLVIDMKIDTKNINIRNNQSLRLDISLVSHNNYQSLPGVVYIGKQRLLSDNRKQFLSRQERKPTEEYIIKDINNYKAHSLHYRASIVYASWMDSAQIVETTLFHDCCKEYILERGIPLATLILNKPASSHQELQAIENKKTLTSNADPDIYSKMIAFIEPDAGALKVYSAQIESFIEYPQNGYNILPNFKNNKNELYKVDSLIKKVIENSLLHLDRISVTGYGSPEDTYVSNDILARNRSLAFKNYIKEKYGIEGSLIDNESVAEDWDGLSNLIDNSNIDYKQDILSIINNVDIFDGREKQLMLLAQGSPYIWMLKNLFPKLRRIKIKIAWKISLETEQDIKEQFLSHPQKLSLERIYYLASFYQPQSQQYKEAYTLAVHQYPDDVVANNNLAATFLLNGDVRTANVYLDKIKDDPQSYLNQGAGYYIEGKFDLAEKYFEMAAQNGNKQAFNNLSLLKIRQGIIKK